MEIKVNLWNGRTLVIFKKKTTFLHQRDSPAAVDVVDLVVLVERYGLQAVCQWAVQNPDT